jgi:hypothetical protein
MMRRHHLSNQRSNAKITRGCIDATRLLPSLSMRGRLQRINSLGDLDPLRDIVVAFQFR